MADATATTSSDADPLAAARAIRVTLRSDLHVSRQVYQGHPVYVVQDPVAFRTHRLNVFQYRILAALDPDCTLGDNFQMLVEKNEFTSDDEQLFIDLVSAFARLGLVVLPSSSGEKLFETHQKIRTARRRGKLLGVLFLQIPLVNPDRFLTRTVSRVSWLFTKTFLAIWLMGMTAAGFVVFNRFDDILQPLNGILATRNLPFLWLSFVVLKVWHELGHGYACKVFGGFVPEMGSILIAGTPAAYVDASSAWSFPERYKRLVVMCGGMFFESLVFIPGVFVWAFSSSPMLSSCAYQLVIMASLVTILFNANPLMKFDGYFILSELIGIQNLRPRADAQIKKMLTAGLLGVSHAPSEEALSTRAMLILYGVSATIYKFFLVISIAVAVAVKFPLVGLALAAFHVLTTVGSGAYRMTTYLLTNKETEPVRGRARLVAAAVLIGLPVAACLVPVPFGVVTSGVVGAETEYFVNAPAPGEFQQTLVEAGQNVQEAVPLVYLKNDRLEEQLRITEAALQEAILRWKITQQIDPALAAREQASVTELQRQVQETLQQVRSLDVAAPGQGQVVRLLSATDKGRFLQAGEPIAVIVDGEPLLRTWINEDQLGSIRKEGGTEVTFRIPGRSTTTYSGKIVSVEPAAEDYFDNLALTYVAGGEILVNPSTGRPLEPVFQIDIRPATDVLKLTEHGARIHLNLPRQYESVASWAVKKCVRFVHKLLLA